MKKHVNIQMEANGVGALGCKKLVNDNIKLGVFIIYYSCHDLFIPQTS